MSKKFLDLAGLTVYDGKIKQWFKSGVVDITDDAINALFPIPDNTYVTFIAEEDNSSVGLEKLSTNQILEYSTDTTTWKAFDTTTNISLNNGDKVYVRGILNADNTDENYTKFKMSGKIAASGNCNALWDYQDLNAPLKAYCGRSMFSGCKSLTSAPELPATILADDCYFFMFSGCKSLTSAPELPATILADDCYYSMFTQCTSLTTAPELPATELAEYCYSYMFNGCTKLTTAPELPATTLAVGCYHGMFNGCTKLTTSPELPATILAENCYNSIFRGCTNLINIKCLATDISAYGCTHYWVYGVSSTGTFVKHPGMSKWPTNETGIPSGWTVVDAEL
jgi:hypothetical protein